MFGQNAANTASIAETAISVHTAPSLKTKWKYTTGGDVSARAAVVNGVAYFPDWGGNITALNANTGAKIWSYQISSYGLAAGTVSRTSPTVANGIVYIGTQYVAPNAKGVQPPTGWLLAIDAATGRLIWKMQPTTSNAFPVITASPTVAFGIVYVGMTSNEEFAAAGPQEGGPPYVCCSVRSSVVAVDAFFGIKLWETFTVPAGYSGGAVWGSNLVVDLERLTVFVGTGNNYSVPTAPAYVACIAGHGTRAACESPDDHADSILALDMFTGQIKWATRLQNWNQQTTEGVTNGSDFWNVDCIFAAYGEPTPNCPASAGPDYDFGSAPNEITYSTGPWTTKTIIGAGQKSGIYYALDPDTGGLLWQTQVGPGSSLGGMEWGSASDGTRIYVQITNDYGIPYTVFGLSASLGSAGSWAALDPATGHVLWQKPDPNGGITLGPIAVANGVVYGSSMGTPGASPGLTSPNMFALDASTGNQVWSFIPHVSVNAGAVIVDGVVYWGSGYVHLASFIGSGSTTTGTFYAFSIDGH